MINKRSLLQAFVSLLIISSLFVENLWTLAQPSGLVSIRRSFARKMGNEKEVLKVFAVLQEIHGNRVRDEANSETNAIRGRNLFLFYSALLALKTNLEEPPYSLTGGTSLMQYIELYLHHLQTDGWGLFNSREYPIDLIVEWQKKLLVMAKRVPYLTRDAFISLVRWIYEATAPLGEVPKEYDLAWADVKDLMLTPNNISHPVKINGSVPNSPDFKKDVSKFLLLLDAETPHSYEYQTLFDIAVQKDTDKDDRLTQ